MLKASYEVLQSPGHQSFLVRSFDKKGFAAPYHFHSEYELTLIVQGSGKRYVGAHMDQFESGDLILIGSNMPHCWKLDEAEHNREARSVVIHFTHEFLGQGFFDHIELASIRKLLQRSECGIRFTRYTQQRVQQMVMRLSEEQDRFQALMQLLQILQYLALSTDYKLLDANNTVMQQLYPDQERINKVFAYIVENFQKEITLENAARTINMTPNAFCKYFKKITRKTFMEVVMEYRINHALQQLVQTDKTISSICYDSGFGDISHFHKTFRNRMQLSPLHYRRKFMEEAV